MSAKTKVFFSLLFFFMHVSTYAQDMLQEALNFNKKTYSVHQLLRAAKEQLPNLAYSESKIPNPKLSIMRSTLTVEEFLIVLNERLGVTAKVTGNLITLSYQPTRTIKVYTISGTVRDRESGEVLIGATVYDPISDKGVVTNSYGYYSLTIPKGNHVIRAAFMGYQTLADSIALNGTTKSYDLYLSPEIDELQEVIVSAMSPDFNISSLIPGYNTINLNTEGQIPYFLGEVDVLQGAMLLPGIRTLGEDANGLNVRGGAIDQNLILLDEATVYNPNHLYGLVSIFNPEAVNHVEIMKGFIPPSYGGRASSVISVHQKEGDYNNYKFHGGIGILSGKFLAQGPIKKEESSFILSGRSSIFNLPLIDEDANVRFQDLNAKINWKANDKNTFYFSGYFGNDRNTNIFETVRNWGNRNFTLRWNHLFGEKIFSNSSAILSEYNYKITQPREAASFIGTSRILDYTLKTDWGYIMNPNNEFNFGGSLIFHQLRPGERVPFDDQTSSANPLSLDTEQGLESAYYASHQLSIGRLSMLYGLRLSALHYLGKGEVYEYEPTLPRSDESITDTISYDAGEVIKSYFGWEPRLSLTYRFSPYASLKSSFTRAYQYLHLTSSTITPSPTDIWKLSDTYISPTRSDHLSLGLYTNLQENQWELYLDAYYKKMTNLMEYKDGADLLFNNNPETELINGDGRAYGAELFIKKNQGRFTGWLSYTLSKSEIKVDGSFDVEKVNEGSYFPANHDKRHDFSIVGIYQFLPRLTGSVSFNYSTGRPFTLPSAKYEFEGNLVPHFQNRNQSRLPDYHRLDLSMKWESKKYRTDGTLKKYRDYWTLVAYNVYGRANVYSYVFKEDMETGNTSIDTYSIFDTIVPGITYNFEF
jgi:hypothetical protein